MTDVQTNQKIKISIQGVEGSFHHMAARRYFPGNDIEIIACDTFRDAFDAVKEQKAHMAMIAIENSLAGSLLPNYTLLKNSGLTIAGEIYLRIEQHIMALPGQELSDITEVQSHPMAIIQCEEFLEPMRKKGVKIIDSVDTALSARWISQNNAKGVAALASELAAEMYALNILQRSVETNKRNFTRFLALAPEEMAREQRLASGKKTDKASVSFTLPHQTGSLSQILSVLAFYRLNLTKIQSAPIIGTEWEYIFYIDLMFTEYAMFTRGLEAIKPLIDQLHVLGEYVSARP
jgi:prephenate dehydratase